jgi:chromosomal replication initiation ATPase DnaA
VAGDIARFQLAAGVASFALAVPLPCILSTTRGTAQAAFARQVAMYLAHVGFEMSLARVAVACGRDRSTVAHACHLIEDRREQPAFDAWLEQLEASLAGLPRPLVGWSHG